MSEALTVQTPQLVGYLLTGVVAGHLCSCVWRKMLMPDQTGQAEVKETVFSLIMVSLHSCDNDANDGEGHLLNNLD